MKYKIVKRLEGGRYYVQITALEFTAEEREKITRFGSPRVSLAPKTVTRRTPSGLRSAVSLELQDLADTFAFSVEEQATVFADEMNERIRSAVAQLKSYKDQFSNDQEYEA